MGGDTALSFGVADLIFFVLAVVTTMIAQGPETNAKASLIHPLPRAGPANIFSTEAREKRVGNLCQTAKTLIFSPSWSPRPPPHSVCQCICQSCLRTPLRQAAQEVHSTISVSNTEPSILAQSPSSTQEDPSCWSRAWQFQSKGRGDRLSRADQDANLWHHRERCP